MIFLIQSRKSRVLLKDLNLRTFPQTIKPYAVILALEIIGEATKGLPDSLKMKHPEIPWREMSDLRDKMVHGDFGLDLEAIWNIAVEDISYLKPLIIKILS